MPAEPEKSRAPPLAAGSLLVLMLAVLYVLSVGPVASLADHGYISGPAAQWFYAPLIGLANRSEIAMAWFAWYLHLFP